MEQKQRFFIHDRKEAAVLVLLAVLVAIFAFTLGIHLGKRVAISNSAAQPAGISSLPAAPDSEPEVVSGSQAPAEGTAPSGTPSGDPAAQALREEVARSGLRLDVPRQVDLPKKAVSANAGATTGIRSRAAVGQDARPSHVEPYALQVGSFATRGEARAQASALSRQGVGASVLAARVAGKGMRFRVFAGRYASTEEARKAGEKLSGRGMIDSYVISRLGRESSIEGGLK